MRYGMLTAAVLCVLSTYARLDYIDADGITERGGTTNAARMIPRTGPDGTLHASLLPPLGSLAAQPDANRLYVSASAPANGNGSAVAPFRTLQEAVTNVQAGGAVICAPGSYSASWTLQTGSGITVVGCGHATTLNLTARAPSSSAASELCIVSADVSTMSLNGGKVTVRLRGAQVGQMTGNASTISVIREDMGSKVDVPASGARDSYSGYATAPYAYAVRTNGVTLTLSGNRPTVGGETGAFLSDLEAATNAVYGTVAELRQADAELAGGVTAVSNVTVRMCADIAGAVGSATNTMNVRIGEIATRWDAQATNLSDRITLAAKQVSDLYVKETNDVDRLEKEDAAIRIAFDAADSSLYGRVKEDLSDEVDRMKAYAETVASTTAYGVVAIKQSDIVAAAVSAMAATIQTLTASIESLQGQIDTISASVSANAQDIINTNNRITSLHPNR